MLSLDSIFLLLFVGINIMYKEWLGWDRIGVKDAGELPLALLVTSTVAYVTTIVFLHFYKSKILSRLNGTNSSF